MVVLGCYVVVGWIYVVDGLSYVAVRWSYVVDRTFSGG